MNSPEGKNISAPVAKLVYNPYFFGNSNRESLAGKTHYQ